MGAALVNFARRIFGDPPYLFLSDGTKDIFSNQRNNFGEI